MFETHGHYEKVTLHPGLPDIIKQPDSENQNVLADYIIATPIRDGEQIYGLRLNPRKESQCIYHQFAATWGYRPQDQ